MMRIGGAPSGKALLISVAVALFATSGFAATAGSTILSDGTLRRGRFDFLNLGYATLDGNDIDRANIAAIILADIAQPKRDVLVTRDGNLRAGTLGTCNPASCTFDSAVVARNSTRWIGLAQEGNAPPQPPSEDTLFLNGKPSVAARTTSVDASTVRTTHGGFARRDVTWIYIADAKTPSQPQSPLIVQTPDQNENPPAEVQPPMSPPTTNKPPKPAARTDGGPSSRSPRVAHDTVKPCPADKPLGGRIEVDSDWSNDGCRGSRRAVLRFPLIPRGLNGPWQGQLWSGFTAPEVSYELSTGGCSGMTQYNYMSCKAPNGRVAAKVTLGKRTGPGGFILVPDADGFLNFNPLKPEIAASTLLYHEIDKSTSTPLECVGPRESKKGGWFFYFGGLAIEPEGPNCSSAHSDSDKDPFFACVQPTECTNAQSKGSGHDSAEAASLRECVVHADRYAVIPFAGESSWKSPKADPWGGLQSAKIHWEICCGCGDVAAPPEPKTGCKDPSQYQAQVDRLANISRCDREDLKNKYDEFQHFWSQAQQYRSDFDLVVRSCVEFNLAKTLLSYLVGKGELDTVKNFVLLEAVLEKIVNQDPTAVLNFSNLEVELGGKMISVDVAALWETVAQIREATKTIGEAGSAEELGTRLNNCAGTPMVSDLVWQGAKDYLSNLKAALEMMPELQKKIGDIEHTDEDRWKAENDLYQACLQYAKCKGLPPKCTPPPDGPTAPAPGECTRPKGAPGSSPDP